MAFIKLDREITNNWLWQEQPFSKGQAWIDLILLADYKDHKNPYKGEIVTYKRGTVHLSITSLANRWGWGRDKTRTFLKLLEQDNMILLNATTNRTTITLVNYGKYQDVPTTNHTTNRQRTDSEQYNEPYNEPTANHTHLKNNKNNKNIKNNKNMPSAQNEIESDDDCYTEEEWAQMCSKMKK